MIKTTKQLFTKLTLIGLMVFAILPASLSFAQAADFTLPVDGYFVSKDAEGVMQIWRLPADTLAPEQITDSQTDIIEFALSPDHSRIAFVREGWLWLYDVNSGETVQLADVQTANFNLSYAVFSPDGTEIAYANQGVIVLNLETGESHKFLEDVPFNPDAPDVAGYRSYYPDRYHDDTTLIVNIGVWEWETAGILDLESGEFHEAEPYVHTDVAILDDGRIISYGNNMVGGESDIRFLGEDLQTVVEVVDLAIYFGYAPFINQMVKLDNGLLRFVGWSFAPELNEADPFVTVYFDFDPATNQPVGEQFLYNPPASTDIHTSMNLSLSPDGAVMPYYLNYEDEVTATQDTVQVGTLAFVNIETGEQFIMQTQNRVGGFQWAP